MTTDTDRERDLVEAIDRAVSGVTDDINRVVSDRFDQEGEGIVQVRTVKNGTTIPALSDEEFAEVKDIVVDAVSDGVLDDGEIDDIVALVRETVAGSEGRLTGKQRNELMDIVHESVKSAEGKDVPTALKVFGVLTIVAGIVLVPLLILLILAIVTAGADGVLDEFTANEIVLINAIVLETLISVILSIILGVRLLKNKRGGAARITHFLFLMTVIELVCSTMLDGIGTNLIFIGVTGVLQIALGTYLNPSLSRERRLKHRLRKADTEDRAASGTLGLDTSGKGYIRLDFFNLFWIFVIGCIVGLIAETIFHMVIVEPGVYQDRAGLLFGPFSPIYGIGGVLMTMVLNRFKYANPIIVFVVCTIIGGAFEYFVSWWMEVSFGAVAWDYSNQFLNINGRTCLLFASMFGVMGLVWIRLALPACLDLLNRIPWKVRYSVTAICAMLMLADCLMTVQALDCWYERESGKAVETPVQQYYAEHYDNDVMQQRFQSMEIHPENAARGTEG